MLALARQSRIWAAAVAILCAGCGSRAPDEQTRVAANGVMDAALSQRGEKVLVASQEHGGSLWDLQAGERLYNWNLRQGEYSGYNAVALSADARAGLTGAPAGVAAWWSESGANIGFWQVPGAVSASLSAQGRYALVGTRDDAAVVIDLQRGGVMASLAHEDTVGAVALAANGALALTGSDDQTAKLWRLPQAETLVKWQHPNRITEVALSLEGRYAFTSSQHRASYLWNTQTGERLATLLERSFVSAPTVVAARFSRDGTRLLLALASGTISVWRVPEGTRIKTWQVPQPQWWPPQPPRAEAVAFGESPEEVVAVTSDGMGYRWR